MKKNAAFSASPAKELMTIPDAGKSTAEDLANIGITSIADWKGKNPQKLFEQSNQFAGCAQDRFVLYVFRRAVYFADTPPQKRNPEKLKWQHWLQSLALTP